MIYKIGKNDYQRKSIQALIDGALGISDSVEAMAYMKMDVDGFYDLPGPAEWWSEGYDYQKHGWPVEDMSGEGTAYMHALRIVLDNDKPENFLKWPISTTRLAVVPSWP